MPEEDIDPVGEGPADKGAKNNSRNQSFNSNSSNNNYHNNRHSHRVNQSNSNNNDSFRSRVGNSNHTNSNGSSASTASITGGSDPGLQISLHTPISTSPATISTTPSSNGSCTSGNSSSDSPNSGHHSKPGKRRRLRLPRAKSAPVRQEAPKQKNRKRKQATHTRQQDPDTHHSYGNHGATGAGAYHHTIDNHNNDFPDGSLSGLDYRFQDEFPTLSLDSQPPGLNGDLHLDTSVGTNSSPIDALGLATPRASTSERNVRLSLRTVEEEEFEAAELEAMGSCCNRPAHSEGEVTDNVAEIYRVYQNAAKRLGESSVDLDDLVEHVVREASLAAIREQRPGRTLDLDFSHQSAIIGEYGARAIAHMIIAACNIRSLSLADCGVNHVTAGLIGNGLRQNYTLISLDLSDNALGERGIVSILRYLPGNQSLRHLNLSNTGLDEECAHALSNGLLLSANVIEALDLSNNNFNDRGIEGITRALACNHRLRKLNMEGNSGAPPALRSHRLHRRVSDSSVNSGNSNGGGTPSPVVGNSEPDVLTLRYWTSEESAMQMNRCLERNNIVADILNEVVSALPLKDCSLSAGTNLHGHHGNYSQREFQQELHRDGRHAQSFRRSVDLYENDGDSDDDSYGASSSNRSTSRQGNPAFEREAHPHSMGVAPSHMDIQDHHNRSGLEIQSQSRVVANAGLTTLPDTGANLLSPQPQIGDETPFPSREPVTSNGIQTSGRHTMAGFGKRSSSDDSKKSFGWARPAQHTGPEASSTSLAQFAHARQTSTFLDNSKVAFGYAETRGRRTTMEDFVLMRKSFGPRKSDFLFGVFDGHGGVQCAKFVRTWYPEALQNELDSALDAHEAANRDATVTMCISRAFHALQARCRHLKIKHGSCAIVSYVSGRDLYVANVGDSRALLMYPGRGTHHWLSRVISPTDLDERQRIESSGGFVASNGRIFGTLAVSRALGDIEYVPSVSSEPTFAVHHLQPLDHEPKFESARYAWLILGCDGLWEKIGSRDVARKLRYVTDPTRAAHKLRSSAFRHGSQDNISVVCVRFDLFYPSAVPATSAPAD